MSCWTSAGRCDRPASFRLVTPQGKLVPGFYCREHAEATIKEYKEKLKETWTMMRSCAVGVPCPSEPTPRPSSPRAWNLAEGTPAKRRGGWTRGDRKRAKMSDPTDSGEANRVERAMRVASNHRPDGGRFDEEETP